MVQRVCIIGAGPCGMLAVCAFKQLSGTEVEVSCYEKQPVPGGLWNYTWHTGTDQFGEHVQNSMYRDLFSNAPKECKEFPDYTFRDHFGKQIPSFPPRAVLLNYLYGYWKYCGVTEDDVMCSHVVRNVQFDSGTEKFTVRVEDLKTSISQDNIFDYVIVASGRYSAPKIPKFKGIEAFNGRVLHAQDFRNSREFAKLNVLVVGAGDSGEDIALQCIKFGAKAVTISYRTKPFCYKFPQKVTQRPEIVEIFGKDVRFKDDHKESFDVIIFCTGYLTKFPFLPSSMALKGDVRLCPPGLYRGVQLLDDTTKGRLFYLGMADQAYTFTMFKMQAHWTASNIKGLLVDSKSSEEKRQDILAWEERARSCQTRGCCWEGVVYQTDYIKSLCLDLGCQDDLDTSKQFREWISHKYKDVGSYRDYGHMSNFTDETAPGLKTTWMMLMDDSFEDVISAVDAE